MNTLQSIVLGALQGVTEFLPVSSSGHLVLARHFLGLGDVPILYDVLLHVSTLIVVLVVFRHRIAAILGALGRRLARPRRPEARRQEDPENLRLFGYIILASVPTALVGLLIGRFDERIAGDPRIAAALLLVTAGVLVATVFTRPERSYREIGILAVLAVGLAQGIAVLPGISRSGVTISAALILGLKREQAGELSFLVAIPAILGALILQLRQAEDLLARVTPAGLAAGVIVSFVVGLVALWLLLRLVRRGRLPWFAAYLVPVGITGLLLL